MGAAAGPIDISFISGEVVLEPMPSILSVQPWSSWSSGSDVGASSSSIAVCGEPKWQSRRGLHTWVYDGLLGLLALYTWMLWPLARSDWNVPLVTCRQTRQNVASWAAGLLALNVSSNLWTCQKQEAMLLSDGLVRWARMTNCGRWKGPGRGGPQRNFGSWGGELIFWGRARSLGVAAWERQSLVILIFLSPFLW